MPRPIARAVALLATALLALPAAAQAPGPGRAAGSTLPAPENGIVAPVLGLPAIGLIGQASGDNFGRSVAPAGDVNGDGHADMIVGALTADLPSFLNAGKAYVYFGGPGLDDEPDLTLTGGSAFDNFGRSVAGAGDVNGDGYDDVIVGEPNADDTGLDAGRAYVYFGGPAMDAVPDVTVSGANAGDTFGYAVAGIGDANGDGFADVAVGAPLHDSGGVDRGRVYVYFGGAAMDTVADAIPRGTAAGDQFGWSIAGAGDVNGDGFDDLVGGAPFYDALNVGRAFVFYGGVEMNNGADVTITGTGSTDYLGWSVAGGGDVNGDGYADIVVGAPLNDDAGSDAGRAGVYFGGASPDAVADVVIVGTPFDVLGLAVGAAGDVDGDGYDDVIVGAYVHDATGSNAGAARLYRGGAAPDGLPDASFFGRVAGELFGEAVAGVGDVDGDGRDDVAVASVQHDASRGRVQLYGVRLTGEDLPDAFLTGAAAGDQFGLSVASAGDVNGDGYDDLVVGAPFHDSGGVDRGRVYVYFGGSAVDAPPDVTLTGAAADDRFGYAVSGAGDVNGDGYDDIVVGAPLNDAGGFDAGRAYVYFGGPAVDATADVTLTGAAASDQFGVSVASAGDVNGDGYDDIVVGANLNDVGGSNAGRAYVYVGGSAMDATADVTLTGAAATDQFGGSVAGAGDVNGDGYDDIVIGASFNDAGGSNAGRAYVYFGGASMNNATDVMLTGAVANDQFGNAVSGAGDVNGDGYDDVIIGASLNSAGGTFAGRVYVYFGGASMNNAADVTLTGEAAGDRFGQSVASAGDVNGDGYDDVIIGAYLNSAGGADAGRAYVYFGGASMDNAADVAMTGEAAGNTFGFSVAGAGDVNGDGALDLVVSAPTNDAGGSDAGRTYLYLSTYPAAAPRLAAVRDVPDDQGGYVTAEWTASGYDALGQSRVTAYAVERSRADGPPAWEPVATVPASRNRRYSAVVPTYGVPAEGTSQPTRVRVTAVTAHPDAFWRSAVVAGASVDNIAPPAPLAPVASPTADGVAVSWTAPEAPDLAGYAVYRSATAGVEPSDETRVATLDAVTSWTDTGAGSGVWFYVVTARDANGNEGEASAEASTMVVAGEGTDLPTAYALAGVSPNPAAVSAEVRFALPEAAWVSVVVVDVLGREVARVTDGTRPAGWHAVRWVPGGLASGTYLLRLTAGSADDSSLRFVATRPVTVVRR